MIQRDSKNKTSIFRCPVHGSIPVSLQEKAIIDSRFFQRLRFISQLGFSSLVFPGAVHTRFSHSLGAMHLAGKIFNQLIKNSPLIQDIYSRKDLEYFREIIRIAALLHDVGHPPFSHVAETILPQRKEFLRFSVPGWIIDYQDKENQARHEDYSLALIWYFSVQYHDVLSEQEAKDVIAILSGKEEVGVSFKQFKVSPFPLLRALINGELDADRMDYLIRDSYYAGVTYGTFDLERIIQTVLIKIDEKEKYLQLALDEKGIPSYEDFLLSRKHMFYQVYHHKTSESFSYCFQQAIREKELVVEIDGDLDKYMAITEVDFWKKIQRNADKKWTSFLAHRKTLRPLIKIQRDKEFLSDQIINDLAANQIPCFTVKHKTCFTLQTKNGIDSSTLFCRKHLLGTFKWLPIIQLSSLLEKEEEIYLQQLYTFEEKYRLAQDVLRKFFD